MPLLPDISVPLLKAKRGWLLTEHFIFVPLCVFGLWQPLVGVAFIFAMFGLGFSRSQEFLPGPERHQHTLQRVLRLFYSAALLASLVLVFWPLSGAWERVPQSEDFNNLVISNSERGSLAVLHGGAGTIQVHEINPIDDTWRDLAYPGGHGWHMASSDNELWIVPSEEARFYVFRRGAWVVFTRPGGYCDSFEVTGGAIWLALGGKLYQGNTEDGILALVNTLPQARYVAARGETVLVSGYRHWHQSEDRGQTWVEITPAGEDSSAEPYLSNDGWRYWLMSGVFSSALYVSSSTETPTKRRLPVRDARVLVINPKDGKELWLGSWEGGVFRSLDSGETWQDMGLQRVQVRQMAVDFQRRLVSAASANLLFDKYLFRRSF
jgi:hypothetical protein